MLPKAVSEALERFGDERAHFATRPIGDADEGMRRAAGETAARSALEDAIVAYAEEARREGPIHAGVELKAQPGLTSQPVGDEGWTRVAAFPSPVEGDAKKCAVCGYTGLRLEKGEEIKTYCSCPIGAAFGAAWMGTGHEEEVVAAIEGMLRFLIPPVEGDGGWKEAYEAQVRRVVTALASGTATCCRDPAHGDRMLPATCVGAYENPADLRFGCEVCCSHGNEDGWCVPVARPAPVATVEGDGATTSLLVGQRVLKFTGDYQLTGEVRAVLTTKAGKVRYVVEHDPGFLHIYSEANLRPYTVEGDGARCGKCGGDPRDHDHSETWPSPPAPSEPESGGTTGGDRCGECGNVLPRRIKCVSCGAYCPAPVTPEDRR